jgi:predicted MFS family arabinose efflux permease
MLLRLYTQWLSSYLGIPRNIWLLALISLINRCGGMVIIFMSIYLTRQLGFSIQDAGYVLGFFGLGALAGAYIGGKLTDKIGYFPVQFWSLMLNGLMLFAIMLVREFWLMCLTIFILSLISEIFRPANSVAIVRNCDPSTRTRSISLFRMSVNLGWTIAPALGGLLVVFGWQWLFWVDGLTCILAGLMLRWLMPPKPPVPAENHEVTSDHATDPNDGKSPFQDKTFLIFLVLTMMSAMVFMQFLWTVPVFFKDVYHWTESQIGAIAALNGLVVFLVEMPLIYQIEGRRPPFTFVRFGLALYMIAFLALTFPLPPMAAAVFFMVVISFGEIFVMPFSSNFAFGRASRTHQGQYSALYTMTYSVANIIAPLFGTQAIAAFGYQTLWFLVSGLAVVTWVGFKLVKSEK